MQFLQCNIASLTCLAFLQQGGQEVDCTGADCHLPEPALSPQEGIHKQGESLHQTSSSRLHCLSQADGAMKVLRWQHRQSPSHVCTRVIYRLEQRLSNLRLERQSQSSLCALQKYLPLDLRPKKTRAIRRQLTKHQVGCLSVLLLLKCFLGF